MVGGNPPGGGTRMEWCCIAPEPGVSVFDEADGVSVAESASEWLSTVAVAETSSFRVKALKALMLKGNS